MNKWKIYESYRKAVSVFFPNVCPFCKRIIGMSEYWCGRCEKALPYAKNPLSPPENTARFYACCYYVKNVKNAVYMMKFGGSVYPVDAFAVMMYRMLSDELKTADMLIPVPGGSAGINRRGFDQAEMIAKRISKQSGVLLVNVLRAESEKIDQKKLDMEQRAENAKHSFYSDNKADLHGKKIILIDDVSTTGSTLSACAGLLLGLGADEVVGAVFAKTIKYAQQKLPKSIFRVKNEV